METTEEKKPKKKAPLIVLSLVIISAATFGISKYVYSLHHEDTDDAQLDADISPVLSRVSGYVNEIRFEENQHVNKGDTLVKLDDRDLLIKVQQAQAALDNALANVAVAKANSGTSNANVATAASNVEAAKIRLWKASQDFERMQNLRNDNAITQQQFDAAKADKQTAEAQLEATVRQQAAASMQGQASAQQVTVAESMIAQRQADL